MATGAEKSDTDSREGKRAAQNVWGLAGCVAIYFFQAEDRLRDIGVTGVQTCALPIYPSQPRDTVAEPVLEGAGHPGPPGQLRELVQLGEAGRGRFFHERGDAGGRALPRQAGVLP